MSKNNLKLIADSFCVAVLLVLSAVGVIGLAVMAFYLATVYVYYLIDAAPSATGVAVGVIALAIAARGCCVLWRRTNSRWEKL